MKNLKTIVAKERVNIEEAKVMMRKFNYQVPATIMMIAASLGSVASCSTMGSVMGELLTQICVMLRWVGVAVTVIGVGKFALAMKDENPDGQTRSVYYAIAGIVLIGIPSIVRNIIGKTGATVTIADSWGN